MPDAGINALAAIGSIAADDLIEILDKSDTSLSVNGTNKKARYDQLTSSAYGTPGNTVFLDGDNGDDGNDGLTWTSALATLAESLTRVEAMGGGGIFRGDICVARGGSPVASQLIIPSSVSIHGNWRAPGGGFEALYDNGSWFEWTGSNPASFGLTSGSMLKTSAYDRGGVIQNIGLKIDGTMTHLRAFDMVDWQNMSLMDGVFIRGDNFDIGFCLYNKSSLGAPGFVELRRCWSAQGARRPFLVSGAVEQVVFRMCKIDDANGGTARAEAGWTVGDSGVSDDAFPGGSSGQIILDACANEMGGTTTGDYPDIEVQAGSYDVQLVVTGMIQQSNWSVGGGLTTPAISYLATPSEPDDVLPVSVVGYTSQSRQDLVVAPNATPSVTKSPATAPSGGSRTRWDYLPSLLP